MPRWVLYVPIETRCTASNCCISCSTSPLAPWSDTPTRWRRPTARRTPHLMWASRRRLCTAWTDSRTRCEVGKSGPMSPSPLWQCTRRLRKPSGLHTFDRSQQWRQHSRTRCRRCRSSTPDMCGHCFHRSPASGIPGLFRLCQHVNTTITSRALANSHAICTAYRTPIIW